MKNRINPVHRQPKQARIFSLSLVVTCLAALSVVAQTFTADFTSFSGPDCVKDKIGVYQTPFMGTARRPSLTSMAPFLADAGVCDLRYEMGWGKPDTFAYDQIGGTAANPTIDFSRLDPFVRMLQTNGIRLLFAVGYDPVPLKNCSTWQCWKDVPNNLNSWGEILRQYAAHYSGALGFKGIYYEVWNEPDLPRDGGKVFFNGSQTDYGNIYTSSVSGVSAGASDALIGGPAIAYDTTYVTQSGILDQRMDFASIHAYANAAVQIRAMQNALGAKNTPIFMTEYASYTTFSSTGPNSKHPAAAAFFDNVKRFLDYPGVKKVYWAQWVDDQLGMITYSLHKKALYNAYKVYQTMLPVNRNAVSPDSSGGVNTLAASGNGNAAIVVWNNNPSDVSVTLNLNHLPVANGNLQLYRIDSTHASYVDNHASENLTLVSQWSYTGTTGRWTGTIPAQSVVFIQTAPATAATPTNLNATANYDHVAPTWNADNGVISYFLKRSATSGESNPAVRGKAFDLQGFIDQQLQTGSHRIVVPPGSYRVTPHDRQHLVLRNLKNVEIIVDGVEMICTETTRALTISHCTNVTVRGMVIDYDPLPFTQGRIVGFSNNKKVHEIELFDGYSAADQVRNFKYEIFRPDTRTLRTDDRYPSNVEVIGPRRIRVHLSGGRENDPEQIGDLIVIGSEFAPHGSAAHAIACDHDVNVRLENIDLFASNCFGFIEDSCDGSTYYRCRIDRRSAADDLVKRADPRLRSLDADAYHSSDAIKGPAYIECTAKFMGDDCVNIHGAYQMVMAAHGRELRVLAKGNMNIQPGDPVELVTYDGVRLPDAKAQTVVSAGSINDEERAFLSHQNMDAGLKAAHGPLTKAYTITLDREANLQMGSVICSANRIGNGFTVKGCDFGFNRSRGIIIKASHGEIVGNHIESSRMSAILVSPEYWWLEAGSSSDLNISSNTIIACDGIPIRVEAIGGNGRIAPAGAHRDIRIIGNTIQKCSLPGILVTSTTGLTVADNQISDVIPTTTIPGEMRQAGLKTLQPVVEINCGPPDNVEKQ